MGWGDIEKTDLYLNREAMSSALDRWIRILSDKAIRKLKIKNRMLRAYTYKMPSDFYNCLQLDRLYLEDCMIQNMPAAFRGFPLLRWLHLVSVEYEGDYSLMDLITQSTMLEYMKLEYVRNCAESRDPCVIYAPNLKELEVRGTCMICINAPNLVSARLEPGYDFQDLIRSRMPNVERLMLSYGIVRELTVEQYRQDLFDMRFDKLKELELEMYFDESNQTHIHFILAFLKTTPNLENLRLRVMFVRKYQALDLVSLLQSKLRDEFDSLMYLQLEEVEQVNRYSNQILHVSVTKMAETQISLGTRSDQNQC